MSLFGSLMGDVEDDPFFGSHLRTMRHMNNMMNSLFSDPFGMMGAMGGGPLTGGGHLAIGGPRHGSSLMPFMPQMPSLDRLFSAQAGAGLGLTQAGAGLGLTQAGVGLGLRDMDGMGMGSGSSYSSSTVVMSNGPHGKPQVISSTSSTKIGPNGIKEVRKTLQDTRTGTKKMAIGHHIGERAHLIEREQNVYSGDAEERQEFINIDEEEADDFDREFQVKAGSGLTGRSGQRAIAAPPRHASPQLALPPAPSASTPQNTSSADYKYSSERRHRPTSRRPLRNVASPLATSPSVREVYGGSHPQRHRHKHHKSHRQERQADN